MRVICKLITQQQNSSSRFDLGIPERLQSYAQPCFSFPIVCQGRPQYLLSAGDSFHQPPRSVFCCIPGDVIIGRRMTLVPLCTSPQCPACEGNVAVHVTTRSCVLSSVCSFHTSISSYKITRCHKAEVLSMSRCNLEHFKISKKHCCFHLPHRGGISSETSISTCKTLRCDIPEYSSEDPTTRPADQK